MRRLWSFRDGALFEAAQDIATDASATPQSRVYSSILLLALLFDHEDPTYPWFTRVGAYAVCRVGEVYDRAIYNGRPLPSDARQRARLIGQRLASDASAPAIVQSAGRCLGQEIMIDDRVQARKPAAPPGP